MEIQQDINRYSTDNLYDYDNSIMLEYYPKMILEKLEKNGEGISLLELGLGHGYSAKTFNKFVHRHTIIEGNQDIIDAFARKYPQIQVELIHSYFETFETQEKFDIIVLGFVLEHVDKPIDILKKYRRLLKPEGRMFVTVPNAEALNRRLGYLAGMLESMDELSANDIGLGHKRYYTVQTLKQDCLLAGCEVKSIEGIFLKPMTTKQLIALELDSAILEAMCKIGEGYPELSLGLLAEI